MPNLHRAAALAWLMVALPGTAAGIAPKEEARALLDRWLQDQNQGDFADYQKLYGDGFVGVRRSGPRSVTLDRAGWFKDRERMFHKKMTVEAANVRVFANPASARIVFVQHWSSGAYSDVGPKQLVLRRGLASYSIVREELFASDTRRAAGTVDVAAISQLAFVMEGEVVLSTTPDDAWASGPAELDAAHTDDLIVRTRRAVDRAKLPADVARLAGSPVHLMDAHGLRCNAKLGRLMLRGRAMTEPLDDANDAWGISAHFLVATVDGDPKACARATWARSAALPLPAVTTAEPAPPVLAKRALAAFRALPEAQAIQHRLDRSYAGELRRRRAAAPPWFFQGEQKPSVRVISVAPAGPVLLSVSASIREGSCGDDDVVWGSLWALWQVEGDRDNPRLVLRNQPDESMTLQPTAAVDVNSDGQVELLFDQFTDDDSANAVGQPQLLERGVVRALGSAYIDLTGLETPILICPC
jgi:hypothetical protein